MSDIPTGNQELRYESNPRHRDPWQPGRKGSLCPRGITLARARQLLKDSVFHGGHRYAVDAGVAFKGQCDSNGVWHGYPVKWREVPEAVRQTLVKDGRVSRRDLKRNW